MKNHFIAALVILFFLSCSKKDATVVTPTAPTISALNCSAATTTSAATIGSSYSGTIAVPYTGGNGIAYSTGTAIISTGVTGLTATLQSGTLATGTGSLTYTVTGTPAITGTASFSISFGTQRCSITLPVNDIPFTQYGTPFSGVPDPRDAAIYQVNMRVFSATRNFQGVIDRLDSIKALGINVIYLMPIYPVGTLRAFNSPYCVKDYKAVNTEFGTLADLQNLIAGAHTRNMSVILDWVANHTSWDNAWVTSHKDWYSQDGSGNIINPPLGWTDVAQLNFNNAAMRLEMIRCMKYWVYTSNCDGFRCDYADGASNDFWKQAIDTMRNISTHKLLMLAETNSTSKYVAGFDYIFGFNYFNTMKSIFSSNASALTIDTYNNTDYSGVINSSQQVVRYLTNHDVNGSDGTPLDLFGGSTGSMAAFVVTAYMKGVPMIYNGQEVGTPNKIIFPFTGAVINWTINPGMTAEYKKIMAFRNNSLAIRRGALASYSTADVCAFTKISGSENVLVVSNLRNTTVNYTVPSAITGTWNDAFTGATVTLNATLSLAPYSYQVLTK